MVALTLLCIAAACRPAPPPPPAAEPPAEIAAAIHQAFPEDNLYSIAVCIAQHESGWTPTDVREPYRGLFQLNHGYDGTIAVTNDGDVLNPLTNALVARSSYDQRGNFSAFSTARRCGG